MVSGKCKRICDAAEHAGLARESPSRALSQPHVAEHLRQKVLRHLAIAAARAGYVKGELLDSDSEIVSDRASTSRFGKHRTRRRADAKRQSRDPRRLCYRPIRRPTAFATSAPVDFPEVTGRLRRSSPERGGSAIFRRFP
jgi:hypothetical protein